MARGVLADLGSGALEEDVCLVVSELVTNALLHGGGPITFTMSVRDGVARVAVEDVNPSPPRLQPLDPSADRGRGLHIVQALSQDYGWEVIEGDGKVVWSIVGPVRDWSACPSDTQS